MIRIDESRLTPFGPQYGIDEPLRPGAPLAAKHRD